MSQSHVSTFDQAVHTAHAWINDLMEHTAWGDKQRGYRALRAVLHALRDRLNVDMVATLGAQLPLLIRGIYYEGWHPHGKPLKERSKEEFLAHVRQELMDSEVDAEQATRAVFHVVARHVSPGEVRHVKIVLPHEIKSLWSSDMHTLWF